jgi:hypothetical protein
MLKYAQFFDMKRIGNRAVTEVSDENEMRMPSRILQLPSRITIHASRILFNHNTFHRSRKTVHKRTQTDTRYPLKLSCAPM